MGRYGKSGQLRLSAKPRTRRYFRGRPKQLMKEATVESPIDTGSHRDDALHSTELSTNSSVEKESSEGPVAGRWFVDVPYFFQELQKASSHGVMQCGLQRMEIVGEIRDGSKSKFKLKCRMCGFSCTISSEDDYKARKLDKNPGVVSGSCSTGTFKSPTNEFILNAEVPIMADKSNRRKEIKRYEESPRKMPKRKNPSQFAEVWIKEEPVGEESVQSPQSVSQGAQKDHSYSLVPESSRLKTSPASYRSCSSEPELSNLKQSPASYRSYSPEPELSTLKKSPASSREPKLSGS